MDIRPGEVAAYPDHPIIRKLVVAAALDAAQNACLAIDADRSSGRGESLADAGREDEESREGGARVAETAAVPSGADVAADITARPCVRDSGRDGRRLYRHAGWKIGGKSRSGEYKRRACQQ